MPSSAAPSLPLTITPVFDSKNHWAALCLNLGPQIRPDDPAFEALGVELAETSINRLPQLVVLDASQHDPRVLAATATAPAGQPRYLCLPAALMADETFAQTLAALASRGIKLMMHGLPAQPATGFADRVEALAIDCDDDSNGGIQALPLLRRLPGPHLASRVGSYPAHRQCEQSGFQWFQGDWALHPEVDQGAQQAMTSRSFLMNLLSLVASDADSSEIEALLKRDPNLSYQLLKLVNSVSFSLSKKISSFGQAITLLGRRQLQRWLQLLLYAGHHSNGGTSPLLGLAALRAATMEMLVVARGGQQNDKDRAYMVGMFSLLDILFGAPIETLVAPLGLDDDITRALVAREGTLGCLLNVVIAGGAAPDATLERDLAALEISPAAFLSAQARAHAWAAQVCREV